MLNLLMSFAASIILLMGLISMVTPIPGGTIMIAGSLTSLICTSPTARYCVKFMRERLNWFNKVIFLLESKIGSRVKIIGDALSQTRPELGHHSIDVNGERNEDQ